MRDKKMKVIFISREGYNLAGARIRCYNFAKELKKYGLDTEVLSFADNLCAKSGKEEYKLKTKEKLKYNIEAFNRLKREKNAIFFLNRFHYHSFAPWLLRILNGNRLILDLDDWEIREDPRYYFGFWPSSKAEFLIRRIAKTANICIAASHFLKDFLDNFNSKVFYIPSGVDTDLFKPIENNRSDNKIVFSWIGTMHRRADIENIEFIINCFLNLREKYEHIFLDIVGDGIYLDNLKEILSKRNDRNVLLKGWIHPHQMPIYLSGIDIGLVPLLQYTKFNMAKSPSKLFEYMAMAKATISSDMGELRCIISNGKNGFLAKDKKEFINKMEILITDRYIREKLGYNATGTIKLYYSLSILGQKLFTIINQNL